MCLSGTFISLGVKFANDVPDIPGIA